GAEQTLRRYSPMWTSSAGRAGSSTLGGFCILQTATASIRQSSRLMKQPLFLPTTGFSNIRFLPGLSVCAWILGRKEMRYGTMNIKEAKEEIKTTCRAYQELPQDSPCRIPRNK